ncbi:MotA/TolQ/ExbB proton channel family protein [Ovoidimarina sediminis]|uniref:MotA/TolQ/ExbB proton channel family protein n=1 Tax=Ovoidimarina sediminis TaxID=3079856 RepID=UPI00290A5FFB|nr:MotA/TolQ/ExbB proton channel family protein [Rhodophyticola sp. MJ-SS7]MDU8945147.1 MotA/TolQ/ExbB proton channel family protein [Rhodophyticola sp. MJ-SS7]
MDLIEGSAGMFLSRGGPVLWLIAALSVLTLALILWRLWRFLRMGAWAGSDVDPAISAWVAGDLVGAEALLRGKRGLRARVARVAMALRRDPKLEDRDAREEVTRLALAELREARAGLRTLELIVQVAPLLGLLGTVLGMIEAFQTLQASGNQADPGALAGGIWEALLTTAAGMGVAIPAAMAGAWFESIAERIQADMEDVATVVFTRGPAQGGGQKGIG